jgi:hypothetical protein
LAAVLLVPRSLMHSATVTSVSETFNSLSKIALPKLASKN